MTKDETLRMALEALDALCINDYSGYELGKRDAHLVDNALTAIKEALAQPEQEPVIVDPATMELAESVGLIGPASRTHNLHDAIQRFHDLICANATIKAAVAFSRTLEAKDEPVAWGMETDGVILDVICPDEHEREEGEYTKPLYTHPKEWVGLKDDDEIPWDGVDAKSFAKAIEAKLKEKNNG